MFDKLPVLGICGWSGSGKTTLIEAVLPHLRERGLTVAVVKHDVHGIDVDRPGKDSDRLFRAGADVFLQGKNEGFIRLHGAGEKLEDLLEWLMPRYDLVLVEGRKDTPIPKVWLLGDDESAPPPNTTGIIATLSRDTDRVSTFLAVFDQWLSPERLERSQQ